MSRGGGGLTWSLAIGIIGVLWFKSALENRTMQDTLRGVFSGGGPGPGEAGFSTDLIGQFLTPRGTDATGATGSGGPIGSGRRGAKQVLDEILEKSGAPKLPKISEDRPGSTTSSGSMSDHSTSCKECAAYDLSDTGNSGYSRKMTEATVRICKFLGINWDGQSPLVANANYRGYRIQVIAKTPAYGDHTGHTHMGARKIGYSGG